MSDIEIYESPDGDIRLNVQLEDETVWLTQAQMSQLFARDVSTISKHIRNVFEEGELDEESNLQKMQIACSDKPVAVYSLDVIISVGYRVKSQQGVRFRQWATRVLKEYAVKGFALDDRRLKDGRSRYFRELLQRVRDIRSSERNLYQQVTDIYATAIDYDPKSSMTRKFFATVQNKLHYAVHEHTAAEVIYDRVDREKPLVGMTTFDGDYVTKADVCIAKNYLTEKELQTLNLLVARFLDYAELQALEERAMTMAEWVEELDREIVNSRRALLEGHGTISHKQAIENVVSAERVPFITVVNIQKFDEGAVATDFDYDLDVQRVYFIDEAHRDYKRGGAFLTNLVTSDREAVRIALTGTPLVNTKDGRNDTKQVFGPYVHKYFYNQSIADGYTLKLLREPVKIEFRLKMQEVLRDLKEVKKLVDMEKVYAHKSYVDPLCDYIVDDYLKSQIALGDESIGAMVVAHSSAQARAIYARLAELDPDVSTELVINGETEARHRLDSELILHDEGTKETRRAICDNFKKDDSPINILVVYNMLLTGFDAHRLKKLYLCRTIKAHNLLQALTRVNRPYKDMAFGYVVDFADITEEYDKTNRAYLTELTEELGDATKDYSSLFEDPATIKADLAKIKDLLFSYTTDNMVEFKAEINAIDDKAVLYDLRAALARYKDLRNVVKQQGYEELYDKFDVGRVCEMLGEVSLRIQAINNKEALALQDMSTGAVNLLLSKMEFRFRNIGSEELEVADEFQNKLKRTYESFAHNFDAKDPEYVNLLEELRSRFEKVNIEEMTSADMAESVKELDSLRGKMEDLNRRNAALAKKYGGDEKFARAHKQAMRTPPPLTTSPTTMFSILSSVKQGADEAVMSNRNMLGNAPYFAKQVRRLVAVACKDAGVKYSLVQVKSVAEYISKEYIDERGRAA